MNAPQLVVLSVGVTAVLAAAAAIIKAVVSVWRFGRKADRVVTAVVGQAELLAADPDALPKLLRIAEEFQTNHGTSMRDAINRIEESLDRHGSELNTIVVRLEAGERRFAGLDRRIVELRGLISDMSDLKTVIQAVKESHP